MCFNGVTVKPDAGIETAQQYDVVWVPSLAVSPHGLIQPHREIQQWIKRQHQGGALVVSVCTGAFLLAEAGLLDGLQATTHWAYVDAFEQKYSKVRLLPDAAIIQNKTAAVEIWCAGGGAFWQDMVMTLLEQLAGKAVAIEVSKMFLMQYHLIGQSPFKKFSPHQQSPDALMEDVQRWFNDHLAEVNLIARACEQFDISESTLKRRFKTVFDMPPNAYIQSVRIEQAKRALEFTRKTVEEISLLVGYQDSSFFRRLFKRETGLSPSHYRKAFSGRVS